MPKGTLKRASEHPVAGKIRRAIGAGPNETVEVVTPQFEREPGQPGPASPPGDSRDAWEALKDLDARALRELGLRPWGSPEDDDGVEHPEEGCLWLFPGEWYHAIPAGLRVTDINFHDERFIPGRTDNDIRFGCLAFGIMGPALPKR